MILKNSLSQSRGMHTVFMDPLSSSQSLCPSTDYGIKPKRLQFLTQETQAQPKGLYQARKSKRDEPDMNEYNYDANL